MTKNEERKVKDRYRLFTNLSQVIIGNVRTHTYALLMEDCEDMADESLRRYRLRGFSTAPELPIFDMELTGFLYDMVEEREQRMAMLNLPGFAPIPPIQLRTMDREHPIDVVTFEGDIQQVWNVLPKKVSAYWRSPYMPVPSFVPRHLDHGGK